MAHRPSSPEATNAGLEQGLSKRHIRMIAIGGAIGVGLFLGSGKGISTVGPALIGVYAATGFIIFIIMRALGELLIHKPVAGSFAEYAREYLGPVYGFITGWGYWISWVITGMVEITAASAYIKYWFPQIPQPITALVFLVALVLLNLVNVGAFGEMEFWFASVKVIAILALIIGGTLAMVFSWGDAGAHGGPANLWSHGGLAPHGWLAVLFGFQLAVFSYQGVELLGMTAAEAKDRDKVLPKAINSVPWRVGLFYVGSLTVLLCLFPWTNFTAGTSPFVQALAGIGIKAASGLMNFVVLTSALSACNSGIFSNGRLLKMLAEDGLAPKRLARLNKGHVPAVGIIVSGSLMLLVVPIIAITDKAFDYIAAVATIGGIWSWGVIICSHMAYRRRVARGEAKASSFRLPLAGPASWLVLIFLSAILILMGLDPDQRIALYWLPICAVLLVGGYFLSRRRPPAAPAVEEGHRVPEFDKSI